MNEFIKLTNSDDNTIIVTTTKYFVKATREEDADYTEVAMEDGYSDLEVTETPEEIYSLLTKPLSFGSSRSLADNPETPQKASVQTLTNDSHMDNLARHA